jgi:hypothetical protein
VRLCPSCRHLCRLCCGQQACRPDKICLLCLGFTRRWHYRSPNAQSYSSKELVRLPSIARLVLILMTLHNVGTTNCMDPNNERKFIKYVLAHDEDINLVLDCQAVDQTFTRFLFNVRDVSNPVLFSTSMSTSSTPAVTGI